MVRLPPTPIYLCNDFLPLLPAFLPAMSIVQMCADRAQPGWLALRSFLLVIPLPIFSEVFAGMWD